MAYDKEKIRKIVRMLEGESAGEVHNAARLLLGHAKKEGHNLDELFAAVYGPVAGGVDFGALRRSKPRGGAQETEDESEKAAYAARAAYWGRAKNNKFDELEELAPAHGDILTQWEADFVEDMIKRGSSYTWSAIRLHARGTRAKENRLDRSRSIMATKTHSGKLKLMHKGPMADTMRPF